MPKKEKLEQQHKKISCLLRSKRNRNGELTESSKQTLKWLLDKEIIVFERLLDTFDYKYEEINSAVQEINEKRNQVIIKKPELNKRRKTTKKFSYFLENYKNSYGLKSQTKDFIDKSISPCASTQVSQTQTSSAFVNNSIIEQNSSTKNKSKKLTNNNVEEKYNTPNNNAITNVVISNWKLSTIAWQKTPSDQNKTELTLEQDQLLTEIDELIEINTNQ